MRYEKPPLSFEDQADQLMARGLEGDRALLVKRLQATNYYRFSTYLYTFRGEDSRWDHYRKSARRLAAILLICRYWLAKADAGHSWHQRVSDHFAKHPHIDLSAMGLRPDWQEQALWIHPS